MSAFYSRLMILSLGVGLLSLSACGDKEQDKTSSAKEQKTSGTPLEQLYALLKDVNSPETAQKAVEPVNKIIEKLPLEEMEDQKTLNVINEILRLAGHQFYDCPSLGKVLSKLPVDTAPYDDQAPLEVDGYEVDTQDTPSTPPKSN